MASGVKVEDMPNLATLSKVYFAENEEGTEAKQICFVDGIPQLEEAPDAITGSAVDIDYEFSQPGKTKVGDIELNVYYTHTQHKWMKALDKKPGYFFVKHPENTAPQGEEPLLRKFAGSMVTVPGELADEDWLKDVVKVYRSTKVTESYNKFPSAE